MSNTNPPPFLKTGKKLIEKENSFRKDKSFLCKNQNKCPGMNKKGMSILYVVFIMSILLGIAFGLSGILISQIKMLSETGYSVNALYAADSGIERVLVKRESPSNISETFLSNGASYQVLVIQGGIGDCPAKFNYCIKSIGAYRGVKRAIEISY